MTTGQTSAHGSRPDSAVLGVRVTHRTTRAALDEIRARAATGSGGSVVLANVHSVMLAQDQPDFRDVLLGADVVLPDGMPLAWSLRMDGFSEAERVPGMVLTEATLAMAADKGITVGFYGGRPETLERMQERVRERWPSLDVAYVHSPPFRELTEAEVEEQLTAITASGARVLFVGLGCPKQERWMAEHRSRMPAVLIGVGAVFDFLAGTKRRAPVVMQRVGLEWLFRLAQEPRRLLPRYGYYNPRFAWRFAMDRLTR